MRSGVVRSPPPAIFVCGMQPIFEGSPCCDIFHCDPKLTCAAPVESDYYSRQTNPLMAAGDFSRDLNLSSNLST